MKMPSFDDVYQMNYGAKYIDPENRAAMVGAWNSLLELAITRLGEAKQESVSRADYLSAAVARDLAAALKAMKSD